MCGYACTYLFAHALTAHNYTQALAQISEALQQLDASSEAAAQLQHCVLTALADDDLGVLAKTLALPCLPSL